MAEGCQTIQSGHHRTWWAVTSQKGGRGKTLLFSAMKHGVQALSSLENTQGCSSAAGGVWLGPCFTAKRRLSRGNGQEE